MKTEREAFEAWAKASGIDTDTYFDSPDVYKFKSADSSWVAWQASRKVALSDAVDICKVASCASQAASDCYRQIKEILK